MFDEVPPGQAQSGRVFPLLVAALLGASAAGAAPSIRCDQPLYDFGARKALGSVEHVFPIHNAGDELLVLHRLHACCGASITASAMQIPPGSNAEIRVSLRLASRGGTLSKRFHVASNDPQRPVLDLGVEGTAWPILALEPERVDLGVLTATSRVERTVSARFHDAGAFAITQATSDHDAIAASMAPDGRGDAFLLRVVTRPPLPAGRLVSHVVLRTDHPELPSAELTVTARVVSDLQVQPAEILLAPDDGSGRKVSRRVRLESLSGTEFAILAVTSSLPDITIAHDPGRSVAHVLTLGNLRAEPRMRGAALTLRTDHPLGPEVVVPFRVTGTEGVSGP